MVFANKQDLPGALPAEKIREVLAYMYFILSERCSTVHCLADLLPQFQE